jgi:hypothetical protein
MSVLIETRNLRREYGTLVAYGVEISPGAGCVALR